MFEDITLWEKFIFDIVGVASPISFIHYYIFLFNRLTHTHTLFYSFLEFLSSLLDFHPNFSRHKVISVLMRAFFCCRRPHAPFPISLYKMDLQYIDDDVINSMEYVSVCVHFMMKFLLSTCIIHPNSLFFFVLLLCYYFIFTKSYTLASLWFE